MNQKGNAMTFTPYTPEAQRSSGWFGAVRGRDGSVLFIATDGSASLHRPSLVRRALSVLGLVALVIATMLAFALPAFAQPGDAPTPGLDLAIADGIVATPTPAPAVTPIPDTADPSAALPFALQALEAAQQGRWSIAIGFALMALTFLALRLPTVRDRVPKDYAASFLLGMALLGSFGASLVSGADPGKAAFTALICSSMAIAFWEAFGKVALKLWAKWTTPAGA